MKQVKILPSTASTEDIQYWQNKGYVVVLDFKFTPKPKFSSTKVSNRADGIIKFCLALVLFTLIGCGKGPQGPAGQQGLPGNPGSTIQSIQFCPGVPQYPSIFPEIGFCIDGSVYAVYSVNDGFLTEIPPGQYTSNGVGSSCNFTILSNCLIQNN